MEDVRMMQRMFGTKQNLKVIYGIIAFIFIFMVNYFAFAQGSSKMLFHDMSMLKNTFPVDIDKFVSMKDGSFSVGSFFTEKRIAISPESHVMFLAKFDSMNSTKTSFDAADIGVFVGNKSSDGIFNHSVSHHVSPLSSKLQQKRMDGNRNSNKKRVNSVELQTGEAVDNTEPSREYILGRCNDYRRSEISLITGMNARLERDDIVYSL